MNTKDSISVIVAALNEAKNLEASVDIVLQSIETEFYPFEIIIVNDGSTDDTKSIADRLAKNNSNIVCIHHMQPKNLGGVYKAGLKISRYDYIMLVNGNNETPALSLKKTFAKRNKTDIVIPYTKTDFEFLPNEKGYRRTAFRRVVSRSFTSLLNILFSLNIKYYNHHVLNKRSLVKSIPIYSNSYAFSAEILIKLIKSGYTYSEVGIDIWKKTRKTRLFKWRNIKEVIFFLLYMINEIHIKKDKRVYVYNEKKNSCPVTFNKK